MVAQVGSAPVLILLLTGIRNLALWPIGVYLTMPAGVAVVLLVLRTASTGVPYVECTGNVCHEATIG